MRKLRDDSGLGLTEVMIAMLLLMIVMLAMLTLLITALGKVADNGTRATAAEAVQQRIEEARAAATSGDCSVLKAVVEPAETMADGRGAQIEIVGTVTNCDQTGDPHADPKLARVAVTATSSQPDISNPVAATTTDIYVKFES